MKTYRGWRDADGIGQITVREPFKRSRVLSPKLDRLNSAAGFDWGSAGSGPAQTALVLLADALGDDGRALRLHQHFKFAVIGRLQRSEPWEMTDAQIVEVVARLEGNAATAASRRPAGSRRETRAPGASRSSKSSGQPKRTKGG